MAEAQKAVVETAYGIAGGSIPFMEGVRQHALLRFKASKLDHDPDFMVFVVMASESDHLPPPAIRGQCAPDWLERCDNDARERETMYRQHVGAACEQLLR